MKPALTGKGQITVAVRSPYEFHIHSGGKLESDLSALFPKPSRWHSTASGLASSLARVLLVVMACLGAGVLGSGCSGGSGKPAFAVSFGGGVTSIHLMATQCRLVSSAEAAPSYSPDRLYRCSGLQPVAGGPPVAWVCETPDGLVFD